MAGQGKSNKTPEGTVSVADHLELEQKLRESQAQLREALSHLERAEKLAVVGGLVNEVAHEINTPLASLHSNTELLALSIGRLRRLIGSSCGESGTREEIEKLFSVVDDITRTNRVACERIASIVQNVRRSSRPDESGLTRTNIQAEIENSLELLAHAFKKRIRLIKDYAPLPEIECDSGQLNQVFLNILVNAVQAIEGEGEIRIRTWQEADTVRVAISDTGKGIPAELMPKIFDPGFTTKSADEGTGLGLSISRRIVKQHGGRISVESEVGKGATFTVVLPIRQDHERKTNDR